MTKERYILRGQTRGEVSITYSQWVAIECNLGISEFIDCIDREGVTGEVYVRVRTPGHQSSRTIWVGTRGKVTVGYGY